MTDSTSSSSNGTPNGDAPLGVTGNAADAAFDDMLRRSLSARPEPAAPFDLADRALRWAAEEGQRPVADWRIVERHRRWYRMLTAVAAVFVVAMLGVLVWQMTQRGDTRWLTTSSDPYANVSTSTLANGTSNTSGSSVSTSNGDATATDTAAEDTSTSTAASGLSILLIAGAVMGCVVVVIAITSMLSGDRRELLSMPRLA